MLASKFLQLPVVRLDLANLSCAGIFNLTFVHAFLDLDNSAGINIVPLHNDVKVLD